MSWDSLTTSGGSTDTSASEAIASPCILAVQFVEEAVRHCRDELVIKLPVPVSRIIHRINKFISMVQSAQKTEHKSKPVDEDSLPVSTLQQLAAKAVASLDPVGPAAVTAPATVAKPDAAPVAEKPSASPQLTAEQAAIAKQSCIKCDFKGCSHCMGQWFVTVKMWQ